MHPLDRPVWHSLTTHHRSFSEGGPLARRFLPDVTLFASPCDDTPAAWQAVTDLLRPGERAFLLQVNPVPLPRGLRVLKSAEGVQMVATRPLAAEADEPVPDRSAADGAIVSLGDHDAPDMLALAQLTEPGPFMPRTHTMGSFIGVRHQGRLAAMAGERLRQPGHTEVSGVCTHPAHRGQGLARRLSATVAARIQARGDLPYLHAWASNTAAIALYQSLGFVVRTAVNVVVVEREGA